MVSEHRDHVASAWSDPWWRTAIAGLVITAIAIIIYLAFEYYLRVAATIILFAGMLTYLLQPIVDWAVRRNKGRNEHAVRAMTVLLVYLLLLTFIVGFGTAVGHTLYVERMKLVASWSTARDNIPDQLANLQQWYEDNVPDEVRDKLNFDVQRELSQFSSKFGPQVFAWLLGITQRIGIFIGLLVELIFVPLIAFYFLTEPGKVREQILFFIPPVHRTQVVEYATGIDHILRQYIKGQLILCGIAWIVVTVALLIMRIPGALLLGLIAGISRGIPVIGPVVGGVPVLAAVLFNHNWAFAFWWVLLGFIALHLFESKYLMPRILGDSIGVHPVLIIISLLIGYEVMGLLGMFIAPPAVAIIRFILAKQRDQQAEIPAPAAPAITEEVPVGEQG